VPIRINGGANDVVLHRPVGVAVRLRIRGGVNKVTFDGQAVHKRGDVTFADQPPQQAGEIAIETPNLAASPQRYEIELTGGVNRLTVDTR
jgi:hypothetical protein